MAMYFHANGGCPPSSTPIYMTLYEFCNYPRSTFLIKAGGCFLLAALVDGAMQVFSAVEGL